MHAIALPFHSVVYFGKNLDKTIKLSPIETLSTKSALNIANHMTTTNTLIQHVVGNVT